MSTASPQPPIARSSTGARIARLLDLSPRFAKGPRRRTFLLGGRWERGGQGISKASKRCLARCGGTASHPFAAVHSLQMVPDQEPGDAIADASRGFARRVSRYVLTWFRAWLPGHLTVMASSIVAVGTVAAVVLPALAAALLIALALAGFIYAVVATRQMHGERSRRRFGEVSVLRERQARLREENKLDVVALALLGDREARGQLNRLGRPDLAQAVRAALQPRSEGVARRRPAEAARRSAPPRTPDPAAAKRRLVARAAEQEQVAAEIESLVAPSDEQAANRVEETRKEAAAARSAARAADRLVADRRRRGLPATVDPNQARVGLELSIDARGRRDVRKVAPSPSPEDVAKVSADPAPTAHR